jgi:hypothetical protein
MGGGVMEPFGHIVPLTYNPATTDDDCADWNFTLFERRLGFAECFRHVFAVFVH